MIKRPKYILTQDLGIIFSSIGGNVKAPLNPSFSKVIDTYMKTAVSSLSAAFNNQVEIQTYSIFQVEERLQERVINELGDDPNTVCICLDRFLLTDIETSDIYNGRFFRFGICRSFDGTTIPRQGSMLFSNQLENLKRAIPQLDQKQLIIVDRGIFSGKTIKEFLELLSNTDIKAPVKKIICFVSDQKTLKDSTIPSLEVIEPITNLLDWVDVRDFSPFGGRTLLSTKHNRVSAAIPYLYPWSDGANASLNMSPKLFTVSKNMIQAFKELLTAYERRNYNKPLLFKELVKNDFPLPSNLERSIRVSLNDSVVKYLDLCLKLIQREQNRPIAIFDMDGTLYELDGIDKGYSGSTLDKTVQANAKNFIRLRENCTTIQADTILQAGLADSIGLSAYLSRRYGINRVEYFNEVWNISPVGIIQYGDDTAETISALKERPELKLILLTSAPQVWVRLVLSHLGVSQFFESIYSGEQYGRKEEIFALLAGRYNPENIISVGEQYETDIQQAQKLGIHTFQVTNPKDLGQLLRILPLENSI